MPILECHKFHPTSYLTWRQLDNVPQTRHLKAKKATDVDYKLLHHNITVYTKKNFTIMKPPKNVQVHNNSTSNDYVEKLSQTYLRIEWFYNVVQCLPWWYMYRERRRDVRPTPMAIYRGVATDNRTNNRDGGCTTEDFAGRPSLQRGWEYLLHNCYRIWNTIGEIIVIVVMFAL